MNMDGSDVKPSLYRCKNEDGDKDDFPIGDMFCRSTFYFFRKLVLTNFICSSFAGKEFA